MQAISLNDKSYDTRTIWFHWLTAVLIAGQWIGAKTIDMWPDGPLRIDARSAHITLGIAIGLLVLARIAWRITGGRRLPSADRGMAALLAKAMHWGFYLVILGTVALGLTMISVRGTNYFNLVVVPVFVAASRQTSRAVHGYHELAGTVILLAALLHAGAALFHQYVRRDGVLGRMIPQLK